MKWSSVQNKLSDLDRGYSIAIKQVLWLCYEGEPPVLANWRYTALGFFSQDTWLKKRMGKKDEERIKKGQTDIFKN